jgi:tripartite-type tricarboxylate transporter receptor subunit TctC
LLALVALFAAAAHRAQAQTDAASYPNRTIRIVVGFAAGGGNDIIARIIGQKLQDGLGQTVVIENKAGAGGTLAGSYVATQPADGYTLLVGAAGAMAIIPATYEKVPYQTLKDFVPVSMIASFPLILVVDRLDEGQPRQIELRHLLAGIYAGDRIVQAEDRRARCRNPI